MENNTKKKSVLEEAVIELKSIMEVADKSAKDRMAKELPEKFEALLKEEINKNKEKESVKESAKDNVKEPVIEGKKDTDNNKESLNEMNAVDMRDLSIDDVEDVYDGAEKSDNFEIDVESIEEELGMMADEVEGLEDDPEVHDEISAEIDAEVGEEDEESLNQKIIELYEILGDMVEKMNGAEEHFETNEMHEKVPRGATAPAETGHRTTPDAITEVLQPEVIGALAGVGTLLSTFLGAYVWQKVKEAISAKNPEMGKALSGEGQQQQGQPQIEGIIPESEEGEEVMVEEVEVVDETATSSKGHAANRTVGNENMPKSSPRKDSTQRQFQREGLEKFNTLKENFEKKLNGLIGVNKKMTKKLNEANKVNGKVKKLSSEHKQLQEALGKYRNQLQEMAIFNTNLASVNNIFVNEDLALTAEDKKNVINRFKDVKSINESEETYVAVLEEMKSTKKTLDESVEEKVNNSIDSSSVKTEKIVEQTAFKNEHVNKIKELMKYVDNHGNKKILS